MFLAIMSAADTSKTMDDILEGEVAMKEYDYLK